MKLILRTEMALSALVTGGSGAAVVNIHPPSVTTYLLRIQANSIPLLESLL